MRSMSAPTRTLGSSTQRSACARFSMTLSAPGRGSLRCCFCLMPLRAQQAATRGSKSTNSCFDGYSERWDKGSAHDIMEKEGTHVDPVMVVVEHHRDI